jgi:hypothetical protein
VQADHDNVSVKSEVFAVGSALYYKVKGRDLWHGELDYEDEAEIVRRIRRKEMPETEGMVLGEVMKKSWVGGCKDMLDVRDGTILEEHRVLLVDLHISQDEIRQNFGPTHGHSSRGERGCESTMLTT